MFMYRYRPTLECKQMIITMATLYKGYQRPQTYCICNGYVCKLRSIKETVDMVSVLGT